MYKGFIPASQAVLTGVPPVVDQPPRKKKVMRSNPSEFSRAHLNVPGSLVCRTTCITLIVDYCTCTATHKHMQFVENCLTAYSLQGSSTDVGRTVGHGKLGGLRPWLSKVNMIHPSPHPV